MTNEPVEPSEQDLDDMDDTDETSDRDVSEPVGERAEPTDTHAR